MKPSTSALLLVVAVHVGLIALVLQAAPKPQLPSISAPTIQGVIVAAPKAAAPVAPPQPVPPKPKPKVEPKPKPVPKPVPEVQPKTLPKPPVAPPSERAVKAPDPEPAPPVAPVEEAEAAVAETPTAAAAPSDAAPSEVVLPSSDAGHLRNRDPNYPSLSRRLREEGTVVLEILVRADGTVGELKVKQSSGFKRLDDAALKAVAHWRFVPAMQQGQPIDYWYEQPLEFNLH